jgi:hypothetical protein
MMASPIGTHANLSEYPISRRVSALIFEFGRPSGARHGGVEEKPRRV